MKNNSWGEFQEGVDREQRMVNSTLLVQVNEKKKLIVSDLDLANPEDRALSLCLKMIQFRKKQERRQQKILQQIRKSRVHENLTHLGNISTAIDREHSIKRHEYLRENHYRSARQNKMTIQPLNLEKEGQKRDMAKEIELLERSKKVSYRYEIKKMVEEILLQATDTAIVMHQRKKKFKVHPVPHKGEDERIWQRRAKGKKGCLELSRVLDLKMTPPEPQSGNQEQEQQKQQSQMSESKREQSSSSSEQDERQEQSSESSRSKEEQQQQQGDSNNEQVDSIHN